MSATVSVTPVFANGPTGLVRVTVTSDVFGDSLTGEVDAQLLAHQLKRALVEGPPCTKNRGGS